MRLARKNGLLLVALALIACTSCSSGARASRLRRGTLIAVPDTVHVSHYKQELSDVFGRLALFGMSRTARCNIYYGGRLKVISERPGPGGEIKVSYYPTAIPPGYRDHCQEKTVIDMQESDLRFFMAFSELQEAILAHIQSRVAAALAASEVTADPAERVARDVAWHPGGFVRVANPQPLSRGDTLIVRTADCCRVCASQPGNPKSAPVSMRKGSLPYIDLISGQQMAATVLEYRDASDGQHCGNRECPSATVFLEPDLLAAVMKVVHGLFLAEDLSGMRTFTEQVKADLYPATAAPRPLGGEYEVTN